MPALKLPPLGDALIALAPSSGVAQVTLTQPLLLQVAGPLLQLAPEVVELAGIALFRRWVGYGHVQGGGVSYGDLPGFQTITRFVDGPGPTQAIGRMVVTVTGEAGASFPDLFPFPRQRSRPFGHQRGGSHVDIWR